MRIFADFWIILRRQGLETTPPSIEAVTLSQENLSSLLKKIQETSKHLGQKFEKQLKPKVIKNYEEMTPIEKNRKMTLKEKMEAAKNKEAELGKAVDASKKAMGWNLIKPHRFRKRLKGQTSRCPF